MNRQGVAKLRGTDDGLSSREDRIFEAFNLRGDHTIAGRNPVRLSFAEDRSPQSEFRGHSVAIRENSAVELPGLLNGCRDGEV